VVEGRDHKGVGDWLFAGPLKRHLAVQVVAINPSVAFGKRWEWLSSAASRVLSWPLQDPRYGTHALNSSGWCYQTYM
jgi:hypothetical protein